MGDGYGGRAAVPSRPANGVCLVASGSGLRAGAGRQKNPARQWGDCRAGLGQRLLLGALSLDHHRWIKA